MTKHSQADPLAEIVSGQWRQIVNGATDTAIITTDVQGRVTSWNTGASNILGWSASDMLGRSLSRIFVEEDQEAQLRREIKDAVSTGKGGGEEGWRYRKDGTRLWAVGELSPIRDGSDIVGFVKILRDRTAQRDAEEIIREERHALEVLNRAGSSLAQETDLAKLVQIVTDAGVELSGAEFGAFFYNVIDNAGESYMLYTLSGAPIEAFSKFPMPRNTEVFAPTFSGASIVRSDDITKDPRYGKNSPRRGMPDGHLPVRSYLAVPVASRTGEVLGGLFFGHAKTGMFNERSERGLSGLAAEAAVAIDNVRLSQAMQREIDERKKAQEALVQLNSTLEQQVTERTEQLRKNEEALRQAQKMEAVGQLTGGVAHDFNNLLQVIIGNLDTLQRNLPQESGRLQRAAKHAMNGAQRAASLTQRLLAFSRRQPLDPKPLDINMLVNGLSDMIHRTLGETISVETVLGAGLWRVEADPAELEAAIVNLAVNARDAMSNGGRLTIETSNAHIDEAYVASHSEVVPGQYVAVSVTDTGVGMDAKTIAQAFEPFFTTKAVGKGTGLGLSQVYGFVKQSGGHVKIYSEIGQGTTVKLYLPRLAVVGGGKEETDGLPNPEAAQEETILVLEDDDDVRSYSVDSLRELGYRVLEAHDGPSALRLLERQPRVDLLFTDVVLPGGLTGAQVAAQATALRPTLKVLFTTGYARNAIIHHGRLDKGVQLIVKPFSFNELAAKVRDVLDAAKE
ncbi:PAS domain S-box protein [Bradyrhizobium manausense]|uniref:PAS domain S-box protein n=1 Tax=Bradyrhizobium manausense TaxID=989370 RepID=UPI001BAB63CD|nr:PAS domain S-box protein [Bradyrhizobium manausense]MBR0789910.1 PAS domain S-box protein [Bradyrhizobium manausense]